MRRRRNPGKSGKSGAAVHTAHAVVCWPAASDHYGLQQQINMEFATELTGYWPDNGNMIRHRFRRKLFSESSVSLNLASHEKIAGDYAALPGTGRLSMRQSQMPCPMRKSNRSTPNTLAMSSRTFVATTIISSGTCALHDLCSLALLPN